MKAISIFLERSVKWLKLAMLLPLLVSCENAMTGDEPDDAIRMGFNIRVASNQRASRALDDKTDSGTELENRIDIANRDFRVYFYKTADGTYMGELNVISILETSADGGKDYYVVGQVDGSLVESLNGGFRMVVMANLNKWTNYNYPQPEQFASPTSYTYCNNDETDTSHNGYIVGDNRLIPMWGYKTIQEPNLTEGNITNLGDLKMLRTMAKIEVIWNNDGYTQLSGVQISKHRKTVQIEQVNAGTQEETVDGHDSPNVTTEVGDLVDIPLAFTREYGNSDKYYVYLPEMLAEDGAEIEVTFKWKQEANENETYTWKFSVADNSNVPIPLLRNHIYRYTIQHIQVENQKIPYAVVDMTAHNIGISYN